MAVEKLVVVTKNQELSFHGVTIERKYVGEDIKSLRIIFESGEFFEVIGGWENVKVLVKEPPKKVDRWRVSGRYYDLENFTKVFDDQYEAEKFETSCTDGNLTLEKFTDLVY